LEKRIGQMVSTFEQELQNVKNFTMMLIRFMDMCVLIPFGKLTRFFPFFLPLEMFAEVIVYCCSTV
jgi:hypothetical protein